MFCHKCGKEIPDGARFCNFCGAAMPEAEHEPRHALPETESEEIYSFSEENRPSEFDVNDDLTKPYIPGRDTAADDRTKVFHVDPEAEDYDLSLFETPDGERVPEPDAVADNREFIDDSYENYSDGEDDLTFMDKLDNKFRRDDEDQLPRKQQSGSKTWLWITIAVAAIVLVVVIAVVVFSSALSKGNKTAQPTVAATTTATVQATEAPKATQAPQATSAPAPTNPPATQPPAPTAAPITEAPAPTQPPVVSSVPDPDPEPAVSSAPDDMDSSADTDEDTGIVE